jgi:putative ABC transport system permease protein
MLKNYIKVIIQNLIRNKTYSLINILGLSTGLAVCLLIIQYVAFEQSYDKFHLNHENKYRVYVEFKKPGNNFSYDAANYAPAGVAMKNDIPEVKSFVRITPEYGRVVLNHDEKVFEEQKVYYADSNFFSFFHYKLIDGDIKTALSGLGSVVLSLSSAEKYFGPRNEWKQSPLGQAILMNNKEPLMVTGIMEDFHANSHFKSNVLVSFATFVKRNDPSGQWGWNDFYTYIELASGTDYKNFEAKLPGLLAKYQTDPSKNRMVVQRLTDIHLHSNLGFELNPNGNAQTVYFLSVIAVVILVIAWVNYINLATARAENRAKEIGVRKVNGASRGEVMLQFMLESFFMNLLALILAVAFISAVMPLVRVLLEKPLAFTFLHDTQLQLYVLAMYVSGSIISGLYPAIILSSFKPVSIFKASLSRVARGKSVLRQSLVVLQFIMSAGLISGTIIIQNQMEFIRNKDLGFDYDKTIVISAPSTQANDSLFLSSYRSFKETLLQYPDIKNVTVSSALPAKSYNDLDGQGGIRMINDPQDVNHALSSYRVDDDFINVFGLNLIAGKNFTEAELTRNDVVILNRKGAELLGYNDPSEIIGKKMIYNNNANDVKEIIGVIENYHHKSLKNNFEPTILRSRMRNMLYITVKLSDNSNANVQKTIATINKHWNAVYGADPFIYSFLDDHVNAQYKEDIQFSRIFSVFSAFSIFIACLGLFGLVSYSINVRIKEIGVRKVLGASVTSIVMLFTTSYVRLLFIAFVIGIPLSYYVLNLWIDNFAYKATFSAWLFLIPALVVTLLALVTVSMQVVKAGLSNPVESLRHE